MLERREIFFEHELMIIRDAQVTYTFWEGRKFVWNPGAESVMNLTIKQLFFSVRELTEKSLSPCYKCTEKLNLFTSENTDLFNFVEAVKKDEDLFIKVQDRLNSLKKISNSIYIKYRNALDGEKNLSWGQYVPSGVLRNPNKQQN